MDLIRSDDTIRISETDTVLRVTLNRPERRNSLSDALLHQLHRALDRAEASASCRMIQIEGTAGAFCGGMDFEQASQNGKPLPSEAARGARDFFGLLKRFAGTGRVVAACVDGSAIGGGVGLAAASDFVFATHRSRFSLPEALWGLLPCCVLPFLIRRVGFQKAYSMALSTQPVAAREAQAFHLVDEVSDDLELPLRKLLFRLEKLHDPTIEDLKRYASKVWILSEETERAAVAEFTRLMTSTSVSRRIANFASQGKMPWEG